MHSRKVWHIIQSNWVKRERQAANVESKHHQEHCIKFKHVRYTLAHHEYQPTCETLTGDFIKRSPQQFFQQNWMEFQPLQCGTICLELVNVLTQGNQKRSGLGEEMKVQRVSYVKSSFSQHITQLDKFSPIIYS